MSCHGVSLAHDPTTGGRAATLTAGAAARRSGRAVCIRMRNRLFRFLRRSPTRRPAMRTFMRSLLAGAVALAVSAPAAAQFTNAIFFGDSLIDAGSFKPVLPPGTGLFTTNPGPIWVTPFGQTYGFTITPANQGGTDYAYGGARVTQLPGYPPTPPIGSAVPIATQIDTFLAKGPADPNAIYAIDGGANDIFTQLTAVQMGTITQAQAQAAVTLAATQLAAQITRLSLAGARYIVVWNIPDIGRTPFGLSQGAA